MIVKTTQPKSRRGLALWALLGLTVLVLGGWKTLAGEGLNPRYVARIKDGQTTKNEILLWFGEPQDVERLPEGVVLTFHGYADPPPKVSSKLYKDPEEQSTTPFFIGDDKSLQKKKPKKEGKILKNTLIVRFKPGSDIVFSHEFKEHR